MNGTHPVDVWLARIGKKRAWLAKKLGTTEASLSRIINGRQWPDREFFQRIIKLSGGELTAENFLEPAAS